MDILTYDNKVIKFYLDFLKYIFTTLILIPLIIISIIFGSTFGMLIYWIEGFNYAVYLKNKGVLRYIKLISYPIIWTICGIVKGPYDLWMESFNDLF